MTRVKPFRCGECGSLVKALKRRGRTREYRRGVLLPVPDDFPIPTCVGCGEEYLSVAEAEALDRLQQPVFVERQKRHCGEVVDRIKATHGVTLRAIEQACGVTGTYLSHVLAGRKEASATLVYLLEAYSLSESEFRRRLSGGSWAQAPLPSPTAQCYQPAAVMAEAPEEGIR